jgi:hypothetical protein
MDLGSTNGTFLNSERLEPERYYELLETVRSCVCMCFKSWKDCLSRLRYTLRLALLARSSRVFTVCCVRKDACDTVCGWHWLMGLWARSRASAARVLWTCCV